MSDKFSVCQFFADGLYDYIKRYVGAQEAMETVADYMRRPSAQIGIIKKLIVTDGGDCTCFEWVYGQGITYPRRNADGKFVADEGSAQ